MIKPSLFLIINILICSVFLGDSKANLDSLPDDLLLRIASYKDVTKSLRHINERFAELFSKERSSLTITIKESPYYSEGYGNFYRKKCDGKIIPHVLDNPSRFFPLRINFNSAMLFEDIRNFCLVHQNLRELEFEIDSMELVQDYSFLPNLRSLTKLKITDKGSIEESSPSYFISDLPHLKDLEIEQKSIKSLDSLLNLKSLTRLSLIVDTFERSFAIDFSSLSSLRELRILKLKTFMFENLDFLLPLTHLTYLALRNDCFSQPDLTMLTKLPNLHVLKLQYFRQNLNLKPLSNLTTLKKLNLEGTDTSDIYFLEKMASLQKVTFKKFYLHGNASHELDTFAKSRPALKIKLIGDDDDCSYDPSSCRDSAFIDVDNEDYYFDD